MSVVSRLGSALLLFAAVLPVVASINCKSNEFWYDVRKCCLPHGGIPSPPSPPPNTACPPQGYYWHPGQGCCVPRQPSPPAPTCSPGWSWNDSKCVPPTPPPSNNDRSCQSSEFWWDDKKCCLPHGGPPSPPSPPGGNECPPSGWYWHSGKNCCAPQNPSPPAPTCKSGWNWDSNKCCPPPPKPSGHWKKRAQKSRVGLCPIGLEACPISGSLSGSYECLDTINELESCGGCASLGKGQDCTAIEGAWNVGCKHGRCRVSTCAAGYKRSFDWSSCTAL